MKNNLICLLLCSSLLMMPVWAQPALPDNTASSVLADIKYAEISSGQFDTAGRLWAVWTQGDFVYVNYSDDLGKQFSTPVKVNDVPQTLKHNGESRPQILLGKQGEVYVLWSQALSKRFSGHVRFSRSLDGGRTFEPSQIVNDNVEEIGHAYPVMAQGEDGQLHIVWLDSRDAVAAKAAGKNYSGSSLYYAVSDNQGRSFSSNRKLADATCQCCRLALVMDGKIPQVLWRGILEDGSRDHLWLKMGETTASRISYEQWQVDSCPHHGPAMTIDSRGQTHFVWFNQEAGQGGLYYRQAAAQTAQRFAYQQQAQHPNIMSNGTWLWRVWKTFDGVQSHIQAQYSTDQGAHWSHVQTVLSSSGKTDSPQLLAWADKTYLSWHSQTEGLRLIELTVQP